MSDSFYPLYKEGDLDPEAVLFYQALIAADLPPLSELTPEEARLKNIVQAFAGPSKPVYQVENRTVSGQQADIPVRIYTPEGKGVFPVILYLHGGGWVVGTLDDFDSICRGLCSGTSSIVISVDYRLSPEFRFPAALEDAFEVLQWAADHAGSFRGDPFRIAVAGDSAGANLAAALTLMARDRHAPRILFQLLICPAVDLSRHDYPSCRFFGEGLFLPLSLMNWYINHYLNSPEEAFDPYVSPLLEEDLAGLPGAFILTAEFDILRDACDAYAERLRKSGIQVTTKRYPGQIHDFPIFGRIFTKAREALDDCCRVLSEELWKKS